MTSVVTAAAGTLAAGLVGYPPTIAGLRRLGAGQRVREDGPQSHRRKAGTPTAGGALFVGLVAVAWLALSRAGLAGLVVAAGVLGGGLGLIDDWRNVRGTRGLGLRFWVKLGTLAALAVALAAALTHFGWPAQVVPGVGLRSLGWGLPALTAAAVLATSNAVNLTDGVDGLAAGVALPPFAACAGLAVVEGQEPLALVAASVCGALLAFLHYNRPRARIFMGDTGALALGCMLAVLATSLHLLLLLPLLGVVFVLEAGSVIAQVVFFRLTHGRRLLRMSPFHHHLELGGMGEWAIDGRLWALSALGSAAAVAVALGAGLSGAGR